jgi:hypothetical protein
MAIDFEKYEFVDNEMTEVLENIKNSVLRILDTEFFNKSTMQKKTYRELINVVGESNYRIEYADVVNLISLVRELPALFGGVERSLESAQEISQKKFNIISVDLQEFANKEEMLQEEIFELKQKIELLEKEKLQLEIMVATSKANAENQVLIGKLEAYEDIAHSDAQKNDSASKAKIVDIEPEKEVDEDKPPI